MVLRFPKGVHEGKMFTKIILFLKMMIMIVSCTEVTNLTMVMMSSNKIMDLKL